MATILRTQQTRCFPGNLYEGLFVPLGVGGILDLTKRHDLFPGQIADAIGGLKITGDIQFSCCICTV